MHPRTSAPPRIGSAGLLPLVLVIAQEHEKQRLLASTLAMNGFRSIQTGAAGSAPTRALAHSPDIVLFDATQPGVDVVGATSRLRSATSAPILVLAPSSAPHDAVLDAGANECISGAAGALDIVPRMRVWLRQAARSGPPKQALSLGRERLRIDRSRRTLTVDGREVHVTPLECKLLTILTQSATAPLSEERLSDALWGQGGARSVHHLRALVRQVRSKIERDPSRPQRLVDTPNGYRLEPG